jgi:sulfane dehydrogenase subunit SoxC
VKIIKKERSVKTSDLLDPVAGNGLLHRRLFLKNGVAAISGAGLSLMSAKTATAAPPDVPAGMLVPGAGMSGYGPRSRHEEHVQRDFGSSLGTVGTGSSRTPIQDLEGIITPSALHFELHHNGIPDIDPAEHRLLIHGLVDRPLMFDLESLTRYPQVSRIQFLECSGNSGANNAPVPPQLTAGTIHGLVSNSDWTGVPLSVLLDEAGVQPEGRWILAEGGDAAGMSRSVPMSKMLDDAIVAIYQNGEHLRPGNGYPMRLFLPGWEGNMSVKWLRRIEVTSGPTMSKDETSKYSDLMPDGESLLFTFPMQVKSVIISPSGTNAMQGPGLYQVSGIAWSGEGLIRRVEVSADDGQSWAEAALTDPVLPMSLTRFRLPWRWDGRPAVLQSRAIDETGAVQPTRNALLSERGASYRYHYNAIQSWSVSEAGEVSNVYS